MCDILVDGNDTICGYRGKYMGFFGKMKESMANAAAASRERAAQRAEAEAIRAKEANERNEREKGYGSAERSDEYWAIVDRSSGLSGELPDVRNSKVYSAANDEDLENKLREFLDKAVEESKQFSRPLPKSSYFQIKEKYPNAEIFKVRQLDDRRMHGSDNFHGRRQRGGNRDQSVGYMDPTVLQPSGYFAIIEMKGNTWYGEVPGFTMMRAVGCATMDDCVQELTKQLTNQLKFTTPARWPAKKTYDELAKMHLTMMSTKSIVQIIAQL